MSLSPAAKLLISIAARVLSTDKCRKPVKYVQAPGDQFHGNFSPDGRLVAYMSSESGRFEVNVRTVVRSDRQWQVSTTGGLSRDGGETAARSTTSPQTKS
jgi:serine/threonine-protein kinase